ncbi:MAG TPA: hypothetical protein VEK07_16670 [Polyangiaceae bacterium]|nr:hypothetical protein [Polyangiaceae bacterium]
MTGPSIAQTSQTAPSRFLNYGQADVQSLGTSTRPNGLNPTGINYSDCVSDMTLGFPVILSGFGMGNTDALQIWATVTGTCIMDTQRAAPTPACWLVADGGIPTQNGSAWYYVRVQDIVGPQQAPPNPPDLVHEGASACSAQPSYAAVPITLWFVPLITDGTYDPNATALKWSLTTDLVGPPAPLGLNVGAGDGLLTARWTANADSDTYGYDVFIDPPPGSPAEMAAQTQVICPDSGGLAGSIADAGSDGEGSGVGDADDDVEVEPSMGSGSSAVSDAACYSVNVSQSSSAMGCSTTVLTNALIQDSGVTTASEEVDDAEAGEQDGASTASESGGIATIPCQYALSVGCPSGSPIYTAQQITLIGETNTAYTIKGLTNGETYAVAVAAVDNSGNPGPPSAQSPETCNFPAPVNDFYALYRDAGGLAGGGFCSLGQGTKLEGSSGSPIGSSIALGAAAAATLAAGRRRRRRRGGARPPVHHASLAVHHGSPLTTADTLAGEPPRSGPRRELPWEI